MGLSNACMWWWTELLPQIMACHLFGTQPLPEPILIFFFFFFGGGGGGFSINIMHLKMSSGNFSHFNLIISNVSSTYRALKFGHSATNTVECHYNVSHIIAGTEAEYHRLKSQKTPHTSPYQMSYGVSFVIILQKIDHVIKAPHCIIYRTEQIHQQAQCWRWY